MRFTTMAHRYEAQRRYALRAEAQRQAQREATAEEVEAGRGAHQRRFDALAGQTR